MMSYLILFIAMAITPSSQERGTYLVKRISTSLAIDGKGTSHLWAEADELTDFSYPWEDGTPSFTSFRAVHNDEWLYLLFTVHDADVKIFVDTNHKREAVRSDRAEVFFMSNGAMSPYYCLEVDPLARVFDCKAQFYRKIDADWSWPPGGLEVKANHDERGYTIEMAISKQSLRDLGVLSHDRIRAGLYRADCVELVGNKATFRWISWVRPSSDTPDFHIPSSFGNLILQ